MQGTYSYIPETMFLWYIMLQGAVQVVLLLLLLFMINTLYFCITTCQSVCVLPNMAVICSCLMSCFPRMFLRYFLNYFEMVIYSYSFLLFITQARF
jgi:hypothetical protein